MFAFVLIFQQCVRAVYNEGIAGNKCYIIYTTWWILAIKYLKHWFPTTM